MRAWGALAAVGVLLSSPTASAVTVQFCIGHTGEYDDNGEAGVGSGGPEDYWTGDGPKAPRGAFAEVYKYVNLNWVEVWSGLLGDGFGAEGIGCTPSITVAAVNGSYDIDVSSYGTVNSVDINVYDDQDPPRLWAAGTGAFLVSDSQPVQNKTIAVSAGPGFDVLNVYQAAAYALYRHNGGTDGYTYDYYVGPDASGTISLHPWHAQNKFIIVHETAHRMSAIRAPDMNSADNTAWSDGTCPEEDASSHSMRSREHAGCAAAEGFAHFYAADVFNSDAGTDCWFEYWNTVVDDETPAVNCESANGDFVRSRGAEVCGGGSTKGVELDWLRAFWDVHTDNSAPDPSFFDIMDWLQLASDSYLWTSSTAFTALDDAANDLDDELESNWNYSKDYNGVDGVDD